MIVKKRMPPLTMDEVMLLGDTYFSITDIGDNKTKKELVVELSETMKKLPFYPELAIDPSFRSVAGMKMCLSNVA